MARDGPEWLASCEKFLGDPSWIERLALFGVERSRILRASWIRLVSKVRKAAHLKAVGGGVPAGLRRFSVSAASDEPPKILNTELEPGGVSAFSLFTTSTFLRGHWRSKERGTGFGGTTGDFGR